VEQDRPACAGSRLGQRLRGHHAQREARVHDIGGQFLGLLRTETDDLPETHLPRVGDALVDGFERLPLEQVRRVDRVTRQAQLVGEREEPGRLPLGGMEQDDRRHGDHSSQRRFNDGRIP
jgi:hypothetical protein